MKKEPIRRIVLMAVRWALVICAASLSGGLVSFWQIRTKYQRIFDRDFSQSIRAVEERMDRVLTSAGAMEAFFAASESVEAREYATFCREILEDNPFIATVCVYSADPLRDYHYPAAHDAPAQLSAQRSFPIAWIDGEDGHVAFAFNLGEDSRTVMRMDRSRLLPSNVLEGIALSLTLAPADGLAGAEAVAERNADRRAPLLGRTIARMESLSMAGRTWIVRGRSLNRAAFEDAAGLLVVVLFSGCLAAAFLVIFGRRSELRLKEEQLKQAQRLEMVGMMAGGIAHDFNNVLSGIAGMASLMAGILSGPEPADPEALKKSVSLIAKSSDRGRELVARLLNLARPSTLVKSPVDLWRVLEDVAELAKNTCAPTVHFEVAPAESRIPAIVEGDEGQIAQALLNLAINAAHAMTSMRKEGEPSGGIVGMDVRPYAADADFRKRHSAVGQDDSFFRVSIADAGVGMDKAAMDKLFNPFFSTKRSQGGSGLGLLMAQSIVHSHRGHMEVESKPGKGTIVSVYLPAMKRGAA